MDDPNVTMEEYIRLEEEKAQRHGQTLIGKLPEDDSKNDKILKPSSSKPMVDYLDDLDYFNDFENEFPAIVYNDGLTSKIIEKIREKENVRGLKLNLPWMPLNLIINLYVPFGIPFDPKRYYKDGSHINIAEAKLEIEILSDKDFLGPAPSYVLIRDPIRRLCHKMIAYSISGREHAPEKVTGVDLFYLRSMDQGTTNVPYLLAQYLFRHAEGRKSGARLLGGHFIGRLAMHFGLVSDEGLRGLQVVTRELSLIDLHELGRLNIFSRFGDTLAWVAPGPERQQVYAAGSHEVDEADPAVDEGAQDVLAPVQAPPPPPPAPQPWTMSQRIERVEEEMRDLRHDVVGLQGVVESFTTDQSRVSTWLISYIT
ncbi:hypothetical protein Tco_0662783 [Tanacetum coccineum]